MKIGILGLGKMGADEQSDGARLQLRRVDKGGGSIKCR